MSFRPKSDQGDENLMQGKGQEGDCVYVVHVCMLCGCT